MGNRGIIATISIKIHMTINGIITTLSLKSHYQSLMK